MSLECIIDLGGFESISHAVINDCEGVWLRVDETNNEEDFTFTTVLSGTFLIFIDLISPCSRKIREIMYNYKEFINISSENKSIIRELYISNQMLNLGYIEPRRSYLELTDKDYFLNFIVLNYETFTRKRFIDLKNLYPNLNIYIRNVANVDQVEHCRLWGVHGIITHNGKMVKNYLSIFKNTV